MSNTIKNTKSVAGSHRMITSSSDAINYITAFEEILDDSEKFLSDFNIVELFLQTCIGVEYNRVMPENFFESIYQRCDEKKPFCMDHMSDVDKEYYKCQYGNEIVKLNEDLYKMLKPYISIVASPDKSVLNYVEVGHIDYKNIHNTLLSESVDYSNKDIPSDIHYEVFPSIDEYISKNKLDKKALEDIQSILDKLSDLSILSKFLPKELNSYRNFTYRIVKKMRWNSYKPYSRSIVNYSAFQFCAEGYPYFTNSRRLYSVDDVPKNTTNKFTIVEKYNKNIQAIFNFLSDLSYDDKLNGVDLNKTNFETKVLSNAFGICIALSAIYAEKQLKDYYLSNSLVSKEFKLL